MRCLLTLALMAFAIESALAQEVPESKTAVSQPSAEISRSIVFDHIEYSFAFAETKGEVLTNEYLPQGETLENWTTLIGVRQFRKVRELKDVLPNYLASIKPLLCIKPEILEKPDSDTDDVVLILWLKSPDGSHLEYNLHRFVCTPDGVMAYQFAQKFPLQKGQKEVDVTGAGANQTRRIEELGEVAFRIYER